MRTDEISQMKAYAVRKYLEKLMTRLDEMDGDDWFGSEGWRHYIMGEDTR
jgi:hypothetical protein